MGKFSNYLIILVAFFMATTIAMISATETAYQCMTDFGQECGEQVYDRLFGNNKSNLTMKCCYKLVQLGYPCHTRLTVSTARTQKRDNKYLKVVLAKSDKLFNKCDEATSPGSLVYLSTCIEKMGTDCVEEVSKKLVLDGNVSKHCCGKLVKTGKECNANLAKVLIRSPEMRNGGADQMIEKSKKIFQQCLKGK